MKILCKGIKNEIKFACVRKKPQKRRKTKTAKKNKLQIGDVKGGGVRGEGSDADEKKTKRPTEMSGEWVFKCS